MNVDTGHLINLSSEKARQIFGGIGEAFEEKAKEMGYEPVPDDLREAATKKLNGQDDAIVSKFSGGKLSKWAAKQRKSKRNSVKQSRKRNR